MIRRMLMLVAAMTLAGCGTNRLLGSSATVQAGWLYQGTDPYGVPTVLYLQWIRHDDNLTGFVQQFTETGSGSETNPNNRIPLNGAVNGSTVIVSVTNLFSSAGNGTLSDGTLTLDFPRSHLVFHPATSTDYDQAVSALQQELPSTTSSSDATTTTTTTTPIPRPTAPPQSAPPPTTPPPAAPPTTVPQIACTGPDGATYIFNSTSIPPGYSNCHQTP